MTPSIHEPEDLQRPPLLRRLAELDRLEPSRELDRAVMERACKMIRPVRAPRVRHSLRWAAPAALTVVLAVLVTSTATRRELPHASHARPTPERPPLVGLQDVSSTVQVAPHPPPWLVPTGATEAYPRRVVAGARATAPETRPAEWLAEIRELRAEGRTEEAIREWTAFRKAYPGYPGYRASIPGELDPLTVIYPGSIDELTGARPGHIDIRATARPRDLAPLTPTRPSGSDPLTSALPGK